VASALSFSRSAGNAARNRAGNCESSRVA
jgi:hypothetical protein